jgi:hypothetical protein
MDIMDLYPERISPEPNSGCWLWTGSTKGDKRMYGRIYRKGQDRYAHHFSYECSHGKIPTGMVVMHKCDVKGCVNPSHLELGTPQKNAKDAIDRGLNNTPGRPPKASPAQIAKIKHHSKTKQPRGFWLSLAKEMNLSPLIVYDVHLGRSWKRV